MRPLFSGWFLFYGISFTGLAQSPPHVGICDLLANAERWNGTLIETRGVVLLSRGAWLDARTTCESRFVVEGMLYSGPQKSDRAIS